VLEAFSTILRILGYFPGQHDIFTPNKKGKLMDEILMAARVPMTVAQWLVGIRVNLGEEAYDKTAHDFMRSVDHYKMQLRRAPDAFSRVIMAHDGLDDICQEFIKNQKLDKKITCRRGCAECCRMFVAATPGEVRLILRGVKARNIPIDWDLVQKQAGKTEEDFYTDKMGEDNKCVFLDAKGSCSIYKMRPSSCRMHFVVSAKELCNMVVQNKVKKVFCPEAEALTYALMSVENCGNTNLADMLIKLRGVE
jgi:Fe-S-cluster containining protein